MFKLLFHKDTTNNNNKIERKMTQTPNIYFNHLFPLLGFKGNDEQNKQKITQHHSTLFMHIVVIVTCVY